MRWYVWRDEEWAPMTVSLLDKIVDPCEFAKQYVAIVNMSGFPDYPYIIEFITVISDVEILLVAKTDFHIKSEVCHFKRW